MTTTKFELVRNPYGRLVLTTADGIVHEGVAAVRAFPVQAPEDGIRDAQESRGLGDVYKRQRFMEAH